MGSTTERGYGQAHQLERERWRPSVEAGDALCAEVVCLEPTRELYPAAAWDLAHDDDNPGRYLGPAHPRCNRSKAGKKARGTLAPRPRRWSL